MSFFERYFAALDGPDPYSSLDLVAESVAFTIQWADSAGSGSRQFVGGRDELRRFIDAGDTRGWAHHILFGDSVGDVEFALGETRRDGGERIGTFLVVAQLDDDGLMVRYMVARSPAVAFDAPDRVDVATD
jgi:hypothetical protein